MEISQIVTNLGIAELNPMQEAAQKAILQDNADTFLISPTGSGKTIAFLLPTLQLLDPRQSLVQCLVLVPSRELALQIEQVWRKMATGYKVNVCYGGHAIATEIMNLSQPPALLIGTPGRIADHIDRGTVDLSAVHTLVLDEFDKSLELGFLDQMAFIIDALPRLRKRVLVSATSGVRIPAFLRLQSPIKLNFDQSDKEGEGLILKQVLTSREDKLTTLFRLLCSLQGEAALIFCNLRETAEEVNNMLKHKGIFVTFYHGGLEQEDRERALILFRNGSVPYLVTTDLAARGLDIPEMKHVIHYQLPLHEHEFLHRNGRTARMHASGTAYVLVESDESRPPYLSEDLEELTLPFNYRLPEPPAFVTIYISGGKKNKLNKVDIVGFFSQKGGLEKGDLGLIEVKDFVSFAAVSRSKVNDLLARIKNEKMKGKKYKIEVAYIGS